jgi:hypothetical protein
VRPRDTFKSTSHQPNQKKNGQKRVYVAIRGPVANLSLPPPPCVPFSRRAAQNPSSTISPAQRPGGGDGGGGRAARRYGHGAPRRHHPPPARGADRAPREASAALRGGDPPAMHRLPRHLPQPAQPPRARGAHQDLRCVTFLSCPYVPPSHLHASVQAVDLVWSRGFGGVSFL